MKLRRPHLLSVTAMIFVVGVIGFSEVSYAAPWNRWKRRCCCVHRFVEPCGCPQFPIMTDGPSTLYYGDYFDNCSITSPDATYLYVDSNTPWPYDTCGNYPCFPGFRPKLECSDRVKLPNYVLEDYKHHDMEGVLDQYPNHYISLQITGEMNPRYGKLVRFTTLKGKIRIRYVAFEMAGPVGDELGRTKSRLMDAEKIEKPYPCKYFYRGKTEFGDHEVLFWLHTPSP